MKKLVAMLLACAMVFSMVACGSSSDGDKNTEAAEPKSSADAEPTEGGDTEAADDGEEVVAELAISWWGSQARADITMEVLDMYTAEHPGITFNAMTADYSVIFTKLATDATGNNAPDITAMDYSVLNQFASNGTLIALDEYIGGALNLDDVPENIVDTGRYSDGKLYAVCTGTNFPSLLYNKGVVEEAGVTIEDNMDLEAFFEVCKTIYEKTGVHTGLAYGSNNLLAYILRGYGVELYNEDGTELNATQEDLQKYFEIFERAYTEGWVVPQSRYAEIDPKTTEQNPFVYYTGPENQSWCNLAWSNQVTAYSTTAPEGTEIGISTWPAADPVKAMYIKPSQFFSVTKDSKYPEEAVKVLDFITNSVEANNVLLAEKGIPISTKVAEGIAPNLDDIQVEVSNYMNDVVVPNSSPISPAAPNANTEITDFADDLIEQICFGQITAAEAAEQFYAQATSILAGE